MNLEESLKVADEAVFNNTSNYLTDIQKLILQECWDNKTYDEIAKKYHKTSQHFKNEGNKLWKLLTDALGEKVSKSSFRAALERYQRSFQNSNENSVSLAELVSPTFNSEKESNQHPQTSLDFVLPTETQIYCYIEIESEILQERISDQYSCCADVRFKIDPCFNSDDEIFRVQIFHDKDSKLPIIEVGCHDWANLIIVPEAVHFFGNGSIVHVSTFCGVNEFLYQRNDINPLKFGVEEAKSSFAKITEVNSRFMNNDISWWELDHFRLLLFRLLHLSETEYLLSQLDVFSNSDDEAKRLNLGILYTMLHIYMLDMEHYSGNKWHNLAQSSFNNFFRQHALNLDLTTATRIAALKYLYTCTKNDFVKEALQALEKYRS